ncbi:MAG: hypothetical protein IIU15_04000 [Treponema sp.]|nr:hypothetical protein [Treponema sp.]
MEKFFLRAAASIVLGTAFMSCASGKAVQVREQDSDEYVELELSSIENMDEKMDPDWVSYTLRTPEQLKGNSNTAEEYSHRTVIVSLADGVTSEQIDSLAADFGLDVVYKYSIINGCALSSPRELSDRELDKLISEMEKDLRVVSVSKDRIYRLNPPGKTLVDF